MRACALFFALLIATPLLAQPSGVVLVAKPGLVDPNFSETVVLVTGSDEGSTVGVILNRPDPRALGEIAPQLRGASDFTQTIHSGGPVLREVIVALFKAATPPAESAFEVLPHAYLTMHPLALERLLAERPSEMRLFAGFSGWAPQQLEAEIAAGGWYVLPASEAIIFRRDTRDLWSELLAKASGARAMMENDTRVAYRVTTTVAGP
jgi:putative transcriptional regulator